MGTIKETYVSFEIASLLNEKGFDEECRARYYSNGALHYEKYPIEASGAEMHNSILCPTQQKAMRWLREEQNLFIQIQCYGCESDEKAHFEYSYVISEYVRIDNNICITVGLEQKKAKSRFQSYEEAAEAAIKYCLENLI